MSHATAAFGVTVQAFIKTTILTDIFKISNIYRVYIVFYFNIMLFSQSHTFVPVYYLNVPYLLFAMLLV